MSSSEQFLWPANLRDMLDELRERKDGIEEGKPTPVLLLLLQKLNCNLPQIQHFLQLIILFFNQLLFIRAEETYVIKNPANASSPHRKRTPSLLRLNSDINMWATGNCNDKIKSFK